ncbi:MAG: hypothetical protein CME64_08685 [Halobacteriovoraceae bacterium]|nr:hypothetical protein [Halobacteriovoraceae bacterium]|tara:strand:- start:469 stop:672 length:204 start_codon:yes stop_codon:yes gene_type:complete
MAKALIIIGVALVVAGVMLHFGLFKHIPLGRLPGDIRIEGKNGSFYFPIVTCLIVSFILSILVRMFK